jgi:rhodanese-related sulfurtransferase
LPALSPAGIRALAERGARVIDTRDRADFASGHIPGSLNIELDDGFGTYVGWIVPFGAPLAFVLPDPLEETVPAAMTQLVRIGWDAPVGHLAGGIEAWIADGNPIRSYPVAAMRELFERRVLGEGIRVLDVRQPAEWRDDGSIPDSLQIFVADLAARMGELPPDRELWVVCTTGHRAAMAASLLDGAGIPVRLVARGGTVGWIERFEAVGAEVLQGA